MARKRVKIDEIIERERFIINTIKHDIETGNTPCVSCSKESIIYHESIISYMEELKGYGKED